MTLLASSSKLGTRRTSLQVRPSSYKPPVHLYRAALRLANLLAKRFADPYIYHVQRHLAVRYVRRWDEAEEDRLEGLEKATKSKKKDGDEAVQAFNKTIDPQDAAKASTFLVRLPPSLASTENSHTIPLDQYRPFKRLKAHLSLLRRAEQGHPEAVVKVLDSTYARNGLLRWASLRVSSTAVGGFQRLKLIDVARLTITHAAALPQTTRDERSVPCLVGTLA